MSAMLSRPRWTHVALPVGDLDRSVSWYERFTPLVLLSAHEDADGRSVWLSHEGQTESPFVLVLVMFHRDAGRPHPTMAPFAHIGIEVPARADVDALAALARQDGCLTWDPRDMPPPVGYVCALTDPDGNVIEISHDQGVYAAVLERWGPHPDDPPGSPRRP